MKVQLLLCFVLCAVASLCAQKHDYVWALGLRPPYGENRFFYDFNTDTPSVALRPDTFSTSYTASYCDRAGKLLLFSNGLRIYDRNSQLVEDGDSLNPNIPAWQVHYSYLVPRTGFFIGDPVQENIVYFITLDMGEHPYYVAAMRGTRYVGARLLVHTIDMAANGGAGKVIEKNRPILTGNLNAAAACKHANGRDWWVMVSDVDLNLHYRCLLTPAGFSPFYAQEIGSKINPTKIPGKDSTYANYSIQGNCFSPLGNYYVDANDCYGFSIFRFDRCSGLLFEEQHLDYPAPEPPNYINQNRGVGASAFSPDERFYYRTASVALAGHPAVLAGSKPYLIQYELGVADFAGSADTINVLDPLNYFPHRWDYDAYIGLQTGPDGRIYTTKEMDGGYYYCTIKYPNRRGKACSFRHKDPLFANWIGFSMPYFPHYRLGPLDGSPCDTLGLDNLPVAKFRVDDSLGTLGRYFYDLSHYEPATWHWDFGDGTGSADTSALHSFPAPGTYTVCLTVSNANGSSTACRDVTVGASSGTAVPSGEDGALFVQPNPASGAVELAWPPGEGTGQLELIRSDGRLLWQQQVSLAEGKKLLLLDRAAPGVYFVRLHTDAGSVTRRLVVE
jgi:hypothetical protein